MARDPIVLNVAEKPSVARALAQVFAQCQGAVDRGMTRANGNIQVFCSERVRFPLIYEQGHGTNVRGPGMSNASPSQDFFLGCNMAL